MLNSILCRTVWHWNAKLRFQKCGSKTYCIKPLRIINGKDVRVGKNVSILHHFRIETYRSEFQSSEPIVIIGDGTNIEQSVHITAGRKVDIGCNCSILAGAVITDITHPYSDINTPASKQPIVCKPVTIGNACFIGTHAIIMPGVTLGQHVIVGANSVVTHSFPSNCVIAGIPAMIIKKYEWESDSWV